MGTTTHHVKQQLPGMRLCLVAATILMVCLQLPHRAVGVDPSTKQANLDAVKQSFFNWVTQVDQNYQAHVAAGTATLGFQSVEALASKAAGNALVVGGGGAYKTVQAAVDAAPSDGTRTQITINSGTYV